MLRFASPVLCLLLAACLTTPRPVFNAGNSLAAGDSAVFLAFVESWERRLGTENSPRSLIGDSARVVEIDGQVVLQEPNDDGGAEYYLLGVMGSRPVSCLLHGRGIEELAQTHGVRAIVDRGPDSDPSVPAEIDADGTDAALDAFIRDAFANAALSCTMLAVGD